LSTKLSLFFSARRRKAAHDTGGYKTRNKHNATVFIASTDPYRPCMIVKDTHIRKQRGHR
jgi:hypothetical protein